MEARNLWNAWKVYVEFNRNSTYSTYSTPPCDCFSTCGRFVIEVAHPSSLSWKAMPCCYNFRSTSAPLRVREDIRSALQLQGSFPPRMSRASSIVSTTRSERISYAQREKRLCAATMPLHWTHDHFDVNICGCRIDKTFEKMTLQSCAKECIV